MKKLLAFTALTLLLLTACNREAEPNPSQPLLDGDQQLPSTTDRPPVSATGPPIPDSQPQATATPTPAGTWKAIIQGTIYSSLTNPATPLSGATVTYQVLHSHYPGLQEGRSNRAVTGDSGHFNIPVMVHDTDAIKIAVTAEGYQPYEEQFVGHDLVAGKTLQLELAPLEPTSTPHP